MLQSRDVRKQNNRENYTLALYSSWLCSCAKMASGMVRAALSSLPSCGELTVTSPRTAAVRRCVRDVEEAIALEENCQILASFSLQLLSLLRSPLQAIHGATMPQCKERMWVQYVHLRTTALPSLWREFLEKIQCRPVSTELDIWYHE